MCLKRLLTRSLPWLPLAIAVGLVFNRCSHKPNKPDNPCQATGDPSGELLTSPVYSPIDTSVYYVDTGAPKSYFDDFRKYCHARMTRVVPAGIYRVRLNDDSPAELVLAEANMPRISPDGSTMYCIRGAMGAGEIWRMSLPNGQPELVKGGDLWSQSWYGRDTLLVMSWEYGISLLDIRGDSLIDLHINGYSPDVSVDRKICHERGGGIYVFDSAGDRLLRPAGRNEAVEDPRWSPDGKEIVFQGKGVRVIDLEGRERQLSSGGEWEPSFTSDGRHILFIKYAHLATISAPVLDGQVWIMSALDGSDKRPLTTWSRIRP